jgi:hypothetical protein
MSLKTLMTNDLKNNNPAPINTPVPSANVQGIIDRVRSQVLSIDEIITQETNPFRYYTSKVFAILDNIRGVYQSPKHFGDIVDALNQQREEAAR